MDRRQVTKDEAREKFPIAVDHIEFANLEGQPVTYFLTGDDDETLLIDLECIYGCVYQFTWKPDALEWF